MVNSDVERCKTETDIKVSIHCITYNHESYISDAIEGFVKQKTSFDFEVLIHDDASTDGTPDIIREYQMRYPELIKPIYQSINQYSLGKKVSLFNFSRAKGKYIAFCEGDDFWIDEQKLQKQFDYMESHPETVLCSHACHKVDVGGKIVGEISPYDYDTSLEPREIILTSGNYIPTSSYFIRNSAALDYPLFRQISPVGDYALNLYCVFHGKIRYMKEKMSAYRVNVPGSYINRMARQDNSVKIKTLYRRHQTLKEYDRYTGEKYTNLVGEKLKQIEFQICMLERDFRKIKSKENLHLYKELSIKRKILLYIDCYAPWITRAYRRIWLNRVSIVTKRNRSGNRIR